MGVSCPGLTRRSWRFVQTDLVSLVLATLFHLSWRRDYSSVSLILLRGDAAVIHASRNRIPLEGAFAGKSK